MMHRQIRVVVVDDHGLVRESLACAMEQRDAEIHVTAHFRDGRQFLDGIDGIEADVVLMDAIMPRLDGLVATERFHRDHPRIPVVVMATDEDKSVIERAVRAGARGVIIKRRGLANVLDAVRAVCGGEYFFDSTIPEELGRRLRYHPDSFGPEDLESRLTQRQLEVLKLVCDGYGESEIGRLLGISRNTVHVHKNNIMRGLGLHSKLELLKYAIRHEIVQVE